MRNILFYIPAIIVIAASLPAFAGNSDVQVDFGVLDEIEKYSPPPMFAPPASAPPQKITREVLQDIKKEMAEIPSAAERAIAMPRPAPKPEAIKTKILHPPVPKNEPDAKIISTLGSSREFDNQLVQPTAHDVLKQIDKGSVDISAPLPLAPETYNQVEPAVGKAPASFILQQPPSSRKYISLGFMPGVLDLPESVKPNLEKAGIKNMANIPNARIEVQSFASPTNNNQSSARRISLARALALKAFLVENNIKPEQIDIRALGKSTDERPLDRIDIFLVEDKS